MLTTITPYWGRPDALYTWLRTLEAATCSGVAHLLLCVGEVPLFISDFKIGNLHVYSYQDKPPKSIGSYHNTGARLAETDWIMKMDVDCIAHVQFFKELIELLQDDTQTVRWFNCGMYYLRHDAFRTTGARLPVSVEDYHKLIVGPGRVGGTNFICSRIDYLQLGGCDERFQGWGWEDYQQIYMLEKRERGQCPLPGRIDAHTVTSRCRDEISLRKARELLKINERLALLHCWHPPTKNSQQSNQNRAVLLDYILQSRKNA